MKSLTIIGFVVGTALAGCASKSGARSEPTTTAAAAPAHQHDHGNGGQADMMAGMCPMQVAGTTVAAVDVEGGIGLSFTTMTGDVAELRQRVRRMAEMHNQRAGHMMEGSHGTPAPGMDAEHEHGAKTGAGHEGGDQRGMAMGSGMMMPSAASVEDIEGGARLTLQPRDPAQVGALRERARMKAQRMTAGECPMMSLASDRDPGPANPGDADHDAHHSGK